MTGREAIDARLLEEMLRPERLSIAAHDAEA